jgi:hypothetical protein
MYIDPITIDSMNMDHERHVYVSFGRAKLRGAHEPVMQDFIWGAVKHAPPTHSKDSGTGQLV